MNVLREIAAVLDLDPRVDGVVKHKGRNPNRRQHVAFIFQSCLSSTSSDSDAATSAKQHFLSLDNQLRQQIGRAAISRSF